MMNNELVNQLKSIFNNYNDIQYLDYRSINHLLQLNNDLNYHNYSCYHHLLTNVSRNYKKNNQILENQYKFSRWNRIYTFLETIDSQFHCMIHHNFNKYLYRSLSIRQLCSQQKQQIRHYQASNINLIFRKKILMHHHLFLTCIKTKQLNQLSYGLIYKKQFSYNPKQGCL